MSWGNAFRGNHLAESVPAIDEGALRILMDDMGGDSEVVKELIQAFLDEAPKQLAEGRQAVGAKDLPTAQRAFHTIKSTAATFGALDLSALCKEIEQGAKVNGKLPSLEQVGKAEQLYEAARKELVTRLV